MTEPLPRHVTLEHGLMRFWLALAASEDPDALGPAAAGWVPATGYHWRPELPGAEAAAEELVGLAAAAGILACPVGVTPALAIDHGPAGRRYRVLVTISRGGGHLTLTSGCRPWLEIGKPGTYGPDAAAHILTEVAATASQLLAALACYRGQAAAELAPVGPGCLGCLLSSLASSRLALPAGARH